MSRNKAEAIAVLGIIDKACFLLPAIGENRKKSVLDDNIFLKIDWNAVFQYFGDDFICQCQGHIEIGL